MVALIRQGKYVKAVKHFHILSLARAVSKSAFSFYNICSTKTKLEIKISFLLAKLNISFNQEEEQQQQQ